MKVALISDTHGYLDDKIKSNLIDVDEIWHAGDFGTKELVDELKEIKSLRGVYGNIDGKEIRQEFPEDLFFEVEGLKIWMTHIGGYPPKYVPRVKKLIKEKSPDIFISGHSHILKVMRDPVIPTILHINPGAVGQQGFHKFRTMVTLELNKGKITDVKAIELGFRGRG